MVLVHTRPLLHHHHIITSLQEQLLVELTFSIHILLHRHHHHQTNFFSLVYYLTHLHHCYFVHIIISSKPLLLLFINFRLILSFQLLVILEVLIAPTLHEVHLWVDIHHLHFQNHQINPSFYLMLHLVYPLLSFMQVVKQD